MGLFRLRVGEEAPRFELPGTGGRKYTLEEYRGTGVILAFYPSDYTPLGGTREGPYREVGDRIEQIGLPMLAISPKPVDSQERFAAEHGLPMPLLADPDKSVARLYRVVGPGGLVRRSIFLVDAELVVRYRHVALLNLTNRDVDDLERAVAVLG